MNLKTYLFDDDRGVSPVIGVILMVAITVILAAVIATFVMNMGPSENTMPSASFSFEETGTGTYALVHDGGEAVPESEVADGSGASSLVSGSLNTGTSGSEWTASEQVVTGIGTDEDISLVWENPNSDETQVLFEGTSPSS